MSWVAASNRWPCLQSLGIRRADLAPARGQTRGVHIRAKLAHAFPSAGQRKLVLVSIIGSSSRLKTQGLLTRTAAQCQLKRRESSAYGGREAIKGVENEGLAV